jgi:hypothetical protein
VNFPDMEMSMRRPRMEPLSTAFGSGSLILKVVIELQAR